MSRAVAIGISAVLLAACTAGAGNSASAGGSVASGHIGGELTVAIAWAGEELKAFQNVLKPFQDKTGITVHVTTDRNAQPSLAENAGHGTKLPDISTVPT